MSMACAPTRRIFELPAVLDFKAAAPLAARLAELRGAALTIDAAGVDWIGGQCLQVLLAARHSWSADGAALSFTGLTPGLADGLRLLGVCSADFAGEEMPQ